MKKALTIAGAVVFFAAALFLSIPHVFAVLFTRTHDFEVSTGYCDGTGCTGTTLAQDGTFYGMTNIGGANDVGVIFKFDQNTNTYTDVYDFDGINGANPRGVLTLAGDGTFYGMTYAGGATDGGVIFKFDPVTNTYTNVYEFDLTNGESPLGSLTLAGDGTFYGMTNDGGASSRGVIFKFDSTTNTYTKKYDFDRTIGSLPTGSLTLAGDGTFYGMTNDGSGTIFKFDPATDTFTPKYNFDDFDTGTSPFGSLTLAGDGTFYGMTSGSGPIGDGTIFKFDPATDIVTDVYDFTGSVSGSSPFGSLTLAGDGTFYGMTDIGGGTNDGVIFQFDPATNTFIKKYDFDTTNGANPRGTLTLAGDGMMYGLTSGGGTNSHGVIFKFALTDMTSPTITASPIATVDNSGTTITWTTDEASSSLVYYGATASYGSQTLETDTGTRVLSHSVMLTGLTACATYHYQVQSSDSSSNQVQSADGTFDTGDCPVVVVQHGGGHPFLPPPTADPVPVTTLPVVTPIEEVTPPSNPPESNPSPASKFIFTKDLRRGLHDTEVMELQKYLNEKGFTLAETGPGSHGSETDFFGPLTLNALQRFQLAVKILILKTHPSLGLFGPATRNYINSH